MININTIKYSEIFNLRLKRKKKCTLAYRTKRWNKGIL
ncbi:hypothetical protein POEJIIAE_00609 [Mannheimia haemolytica]